MTSPEEPEERPLELLDGSKAITETQVTAGPNPARSALVVVVAAMVVVAVAWSLIRGGRSADEAATEPTAQTDEAADADPTPTTAAPQTTTSTTLGEAPLLGETTGLWLFFGGEDPLQRLDLDAATVDRFGLRAWPLAAIGNELVVTAEGSGSIGWVSLDNPGEQALVWNEALAAASVEPGHIWLLTAEPAAWSLINVEQNQTVEQRPVPEQVSSAHQSAVRQRFLLSGADLVATANGIYQAEDGGYRRVGEGHLHDFDHDRALVEQCGATLDDCELQWFDRATWEPLELPVPATPIDSARLLGDGSWIRSMSPDGERSQLLSLETGESIDLEGFGGALTISPDGRWLAFNEPDVGLSLVDLRAGTLIQRIDAFSTSTLR